MLPEREGEPAELPHSLTYILGIKTMVMQRLSSHVCKLLGVLVEVTVCLEKPQSNVSDPKQCDRYVADLTSQFRTAGLAALPRRLDLTAEGPQALRRRFSGCFFFFMHGLTGTDVHVGVRSAR